MVIKIKYTVHCYKYTKAEKVSTVAEDLLKEEVFARLYNVTQKQYYYSEALEYGPRPLRGGQ